MIPAQVDFQFEFGDREQAIVGALNPLERLVKESWMNGASYIYDAVMTIGLGACNALETMNATGTALTGKQHLEGIRATEFEGASGRIKFGNPSAPGSRDSDTIFFGVVNVLPNGTEG